jgi:hypothetical protein
MTPEERKARHAENQRAYYEANREKVSERRRAYREANREKESERHRAYYEANREKESERYRSYREANREKRAEWKRAWYAANREKALEYARAGVRSCNDCYIARRLGLPVKQAPRDLIDAKRAQILIYRSINELLTTIKEKQDER